MQHNRNDSVDYIGSVSSLTSISSEKSVKIYEEKLKPKIDSIRKSDSDIDDQVRKAEKIIEEFSLGSQSTYTYGKAPKETSVKLDKIMIAMIKHAEESASGGREGLSYVASAIVACSDQEEDESEALAALGTTWLTHLLFIFKTSRSHRTQVNERPSDFATPTIEVTQAHLLDGVGENRKSSFHDDVLVRDGYRCILTGSYDLKHPTPAGNFQSELVGAHILRRAVCEFDNNPKSRSFKSALTTFDILLNFTNLPIKTLDEMRDEIDHPSNGMLLEIHSHKSFDNFAWCLKGTDTKDMYEVKIFKSHLLWRKPENNIITFKDHSKDFKKKGSIALPNPVYIAIHAAIAGVMNMSGAGKFFDELLDEYKDDESNDHPLHCWPELEALMDERLLRENIAAVFHSVRVN